MVQGEGAAIWSIRIYDLINLTEHKNKNVSNKDEPIWRAFPLSSRRRRCSRLVDSERWLALFCRRLCSWWSWRRGTTSSLWLDISSILGNRHHGNDPTSAGLNDRSSSCKRRWISLTCLPINRYYSRQSLTWWTCIHSNVCLIIKVLLLESCMPGDCNHQINWILYWNNVTNQIRIDVERPHKSFAHSGDESCHQIQRALRS